MYTNPDELISQLLRDQHNNSPVTPGSYPEGDGSKFIPLAVVLRGLLSSYSKWVPNSIISFLFKLLDNLQEKEELAAAHPLIRLLSGSGRFPPSLYFLLSCIISIIGASKLSKSNPLLLSHILSVLFPVYRSILAIETPRINDDERWLTYWSFFGLFTILDHQAEKIQKIFRMYFIPKLIFFLWLSQDGSLVVYRRLIRPFFIN
jgi:hypothetical protein